MAQVTKLERISNMFCNGILSLFSSELLYTTSNYLDIYKYLHLHVAILKKKGFSLFIIESFYFDYFKAEFTDVYHEFETNALYYDSQERS